MSRLMSCWASALLALTQAVFAAAANPAFSTTCRGKPYVYDSLVGYGFVPSDARDKFGDTISMGSSIAINGWSKKSDGSFTGELFALPDRGWNTNGTINFTPRVHKFQLTFTPVATSSSSSPAPTNIKLSYLDTVLLTGPDGQLATGLDPDQSGGLDYAGFPTLPAATYPGDGFGGAGPGGKRISIDAEGLVVDQSCGSLWISDEYGPYIYKFTPTGKMVAAIRPPDATIPLRQGLVSFASDNPPRYDPSKHPVPVAPSQGRSNNQGLEGLTASPDGKFLYALMQSALIHEGGSSSSARRHARLLQYTVPPARSRTSPTLVAEYVVPLPTYLNANGNTRIAAQSEIKYVSPTQLLVLPRDGAGLGTDDPLSRYRHVDVIDISAATNIKGVADAFNTSIVSTAGVLNSGVTAATVCPFLDFNLNDQLGKFGLHNGGAFDSGLLNEKWEGLALVPVVGGGSDEYYLFASSDNDFITQNGFMNFGEIQYSDISGLSLNNQMLVFKIKLPPGSKPRVG